MFQGQRDPTKTPSSLHLNVPHSSPPRPPKGADSERFVMADDWKHFLTWEPGVICTSSVYVILVNPQNNSVGKLWLRKLAKVD